MRQPIQVLVYVARLNGGECQYLMLHRIIRQDLGLDDFWQGVTGGVEDSETPLQAAYRELREETGFVPDRLVDLGYSYTFPLSDKWRDLYADGVEEIREFVFVAEVSGREEPRIDPREHDVWQWSSFEEALVLLYWPENITALCRADAWLRHQTAYPDHAP
jgi:dATP pyrophosphohydrolase